MPYSPPLFPESLNRMSITQWMLLALGTTVAITGFYAGCRLHPSDLVSKLGIVSFLFLGVTGVFIMAYSLALSFMAETQRLASTNRTVTVRNGRTDNRSDEYLVEFQNSPPPPYEFLTNAGTSQQSPNATNLTINNSGNIVKILKSRDQLTLQKLTK